MPQAIQTHRTALYAARIIAYIVLAASTFLAHAATADDQPNFIIVMTDDQGWGDAGYAGHPRLKTPNLDAMAASGLRFDRFYATASMCSPTRVATLTGRNNLRFGIGGPISQGEDHLPKEEITIAEALAPLGYVSGHFGKWHVGDIVNEEDSTNIMHPGMAGFAEWFSTRNVLPTFDPYLGKFDITQHYYHNGRYVSEDEGIRGDDSRIVMDAALGFVQDRANDKKPFFAFICFHAVHYPLGLIPEYAEPYTDITDKTTKNYYSNITAIDAAVGRFAVPSARAIFRKTPCSGSVRTTAPISKETMRLGRAQRGLIAGAKASCMRAASVCRDCWNGRVAFRNHV